MSDIMDPSLVDEKIVNQVLSAIVNGLQAVKPIPIRYAAVTALNNSLEFTAHNFDVDAERDMIMSSICEATQCTDVSPFANVYVRRIAFIDLTLCYVT